MCNFHIILFYCRTYEKPNVCSKRLQSHVDFLSHNITLKLKSKSNSSLSFHFNHDCFRFLLGGKGRPTQDGKGVLLDKADFASLNLPLGWDQCLDKNGDGVAIQYPVRIDPHLSWSAQRLASYNGELVDKPRMPLEKLTIDFVRKPFSVSL